ncbi:MAG: O-antigen ligase family protein [Clostridia bacterium]|nr:O-antigen ligase family protein [Clostridia bacterium]
MLFRKQILIILAAAIGGFHVLLGLMKYYMDVSSLQAAEPYILLFLALYAAVYCIANKNKPAPKADMILLALLPAALVLSCIVMGRQQGRNYFVYNQRALVDLCISVFVLYPLGKAAARAKNKKPVAVLAAILMGLWTAFMIYVLINTFTYRLVRWPNGVEIGLDKEALLCMNCNPNTTGAFEMMFFFMSFILFWICKKPVLKACCIFTAVIHFIGLAMSGSRAAFLAAALGVMGMTGLLVYRKLKCGILLKLFFAVSAGLLSGLALYELQRGIVNLHEAITHFKQMIGIESYKKDITTLNSTGTGRLYIWKAAVKSMFSSSQRFLTGVTPAAVSNMISYFTDGKRDVYTHNQFLEIGVATGVPAMAVYCTWLAVLGVRGFKILKSKPEHLASWCLVAFILVLIAANLPEATLFYYEFITGAMFVFLCGWLSSLEYAGQKSASWNKTGKKRKRRK